MQENKFLYITIGISLLVLVFGLFLVSNSNKKSAQNALTDLSTGERVDVGLDSSDHVLGPEDATVTVVEFSDFECPACSSYQPLIKQVLAERGDKIKFVYKHFPLVQIHPNAMGAAIASEAAAAQGKFWEFHDVLFATQNDWRGNSYRNASDFETYAETSGLDLDLFRQALENEDALRSKVTTDMQLARTLSVNGTPTFFINGAKLNNPRSVDDFITLIDAELAEVSDMDTSDVTSNDSEALSIPHKHANFQVYINGTSLDFTDQKYQATVLQEGNGDLIHFSEGSMTLGSFFESLDHKLTNTCLTTDSGDEYCSDDSSKLFAYINGEEVEDFSSYELQDLDRILVSYGPNNFAVARLIDDVPDTACIYSGTCPERGDSPEVYNVE